MIQNNSNFIIVQYLLLVVEWRSWGHASSSVLDLYLFYQWASQGMFFLWWSKTQLPKHLVSICITTVNVTPLAKTSHEA